MAGDMDTTQTKRTELAPVSESNRADILARGRRVMDVEMAAVAEARSLMGDSFVDAVEAILGCRGRICLTGVGKAGLIGQKIQATLASTGTLAYCLHPVEALHGDLGMIQGDDVVLALSKSGSSELVTLLPRLQALGCQVILLTSNPASQAASHSDVVLSIGTTEEACPLQLAPSSSTTAMLALGDALALTVMDQKAIQPEQYAQYHPGGALGRLLMKTGEVMRSGSDCPCVPDTATVAQCHRAILDAPRRAGAAAVVDKEQHLVGIVTHGDFFRLFNTGQSMAAQLVSAVMTKDPKRIVSGAPVTEALALMGRFAIDELPVVDDQNKLMGMIDIQDLLAKGFSVVDEPA